ncbi:MAG: DUF1190 domain-containing protein [Hyphomicrobiaceae bacterium]
MKRSRYVALFSMGASALVLAACEDPNELLPVKAYDNVAACVADGFSEAQCSSAMVAAENAYEQAYPKYDSKYDCEANAGTGKCEVDHPSSRSGSWRPSMLGFMMGAAIGSRVQPQPIVANAASPTGRATATGVPLAGRGSSLTMPRHATAPLTQTNVAKAHTHSRGGFGSTATKVAGGGSSSGGSRAHAGG